MARYSVCSSMGICAGKVSFIYSYLDFQSRFCQEIISIQDDI